MGTRSLTFVYDEDGKKLINMYRQYDGYPSGRGMKKPRLAGHIAGSVNKHSGYVVIYIGSKAYFAHRLAWL